MINSYPKVYNIGHPAIKELLEDEVIVEEKIDGSQFSFKKTKEGIEARSKGKQINIEAPEKMFEQAVRVVRLLEPILINDVTYRGEYLNKPKHNSLQYSRIPKDNIILFDINIGLETYLSYEDKVKEAERIGLEIVPLLYKGKISEVEILHSFLEKESCLGGNKIEGFVIKNYSKFSPDKKAMMGKHVSETFKEIHSIEWKKSNPSNKDILDIILEQIKTEARWEKAIQHLRDNGTLENSPRDIGNLIKEIQKDTKEECIDLIKNELFKWAWPHLSRKIISRFPEWYKNKLMEDQFKCNT